jgi:N6-L-threonylcarbamoyladenine synthase
MARTHDARFEAVLGEFAIDNGAMVAWTGVLAWTHGVVTPFDVSCVKPRWRLEEVEISWLR